MAQLTSWITTSVINTLLKNSKIHRNILTLMWILLQELYLNEMHILCGSKNILLMNIIYLIVYLHWTFDA